MIRATSFWILLAVLASGSVAIANPNSAQDHIDRASMLHAAGSYAEALDELKTAYALDPRPALLYGIAQLHVKLGMCAEAIAFYERFLASKPKPGPAGAARQAIEVCRSNPPPVPDLPKPVPVSKPPPKIVPAKPRIVQERIDRPWYTDAFGDVLVSGGLVAGAAGGWMYLTALRKLDDTDQSTSYSQHADLVEQARTDRTYALVLGGAGAGLVIAGMLRYALGDRHVLVERRVALVPTADGAAVTLGGTF